MFTKRLGIDLGTANSLVWLAAPAQRFPRRGGERVCGAGARSKNKVYVY